MMVFCVSQESVAVQTSLIQEKNRIKCTRGSIVQDLSDENNHKSYDINTNKTLITTYFPSISLPQCFCTAGRPFFLGSDTAVLIPVSGSTDINCATPILPVCAVKFC